MKCHNCETENAHEAVYCGGCGTRLAPLQNVASSVSFPTTATVVEAAAIPFEQAYASPAQGAGAALGNGFKEYFHYQRQIENKTRESREMNAAVFYAEQEYQRLSNRWKSCLVATAFFAFMGAYIGFQMLTSTDAPTASSTVLIGAILFGAMAAPVPFGFMPIKDFITNHGFFVVFAWVFIAIAFMFVIVFAVFAGAPYAIYLRHKISQAKQDMESLQHHAQALKTELASY